MTPDHITILNDAVSASAKAFDEVADRRPKSISDDDLIPLIAGGMATAIVAQMFHNAPASSREAVKDLALSIFARSVEQADRLMSSNEGTIQ
ncbi:hypothetical protein [Brucella anthropi]|uniref:hypothetical protein n=1 Tax=Brucella anthropi TaxID=529 RepID=UPI002447B11C|nr:hypothetical protein [Brucella anthropi]MDH0368015.1 hypothetical protein [Brucella anthropi]